jgi:hypothetical protein
MAWNYNNRVIREGRSWTDDNGVTHPTNWGSWSEAEKATAGLVFVADPAPFDNRFFWDANTPKALDDVNEVDENGDPVLDEDGNQVVTKGLKSTFKSQVKTQAGGLLSPTDWYIVRNAESGVAVPASVTAYRSAVRAHCESLEEVIEGAADHAAFVALFDSTEESPSLFTQWPQ